MQRYHIKINLSDHNVIDVEAEADSFEDAVDIIFTKEETERLIGDNEIESIRLIETETINPVIQERFLLHESSEPGYWVFTDRQNGLICKFLERQYSKDYKITDLDGIPITDLFTMANLLSEMSDYLIAKHPELIC